MSLIPCPASGSSPGSSSLSTLRCDCGIIISSHSISWRRLNHFPVSHGLQISINRDQFRISYISFNLASRTTFLSSATNFESNFNSKSLSPQLQKSSISSILSSSARITNQHVSGCPSGNQVYSSLTKNQLQCKCWASIRPPRFQCSIFTVPTPQYKRSQSRMPQTRP